MASTANLVLLSSQMALAQAMDIVANNVANANTTGFKREAIAFDTFLGKSAPGDNTPVNFVFDRSTYRDTSNGPIVKTGNPLDLAIQGRGYFQIQMPDGSKAYTRAGSFQLDADGQVVTPSGLPLIGDGGSITLPNTVSEINIAGDGFISARVDSSSALAQIGKVVLIDFPDEQQMQPIGNGLYVTAQAGQPSTEGAIKQGSLERSNVEAVTEITNMIRITRSYEQAANIIEKENQRASDAIQRLTRTYN